MSRGLPDWALRGRGHWLHTGRRRPPFARAPEPGQESVWDYPRPPRLERDPRRVEVRCGGVLLASTIRSWRMLETASPPTFYLPPEDLRLEHLEPAGGSSRCEWKGEARYHDVVVGEIRLRGVAWSYPEPFPPFEAIADHVSFYPAHLECSVDGEQVRPQPGGFYGGWVTSEVVGPFKGEAGTGSW